MEYGAGSKLASQSGKITEVEGKKSERGYSGSPERKLQKGLICDPSVLTCTLFWLVPWRGGKGSCMGVSN